MNLSLHASVTKQALSTFVSPIIPRLGETISLNDCLFQVIDICYQVVNQESSHASIRVAPINDAARQYIGGMLLKAS